MIYPKDLFYGGYIHFQNIFQCEFTQRMQFLKQLLTKSFLSTGDFHMNIHNHSFISILQK